MLTRKIEKDINNWIKHDSRALLLYGVRQAGKTFVIRKCLKESGCEFVEFNLIEEPEIVHILENSTSVDDLITKLSLYTDKKLVPGQTYIFFDEIQRYKDILTAIKFLVEDERYKYVLSGSLLGVEITNLKSAPVGYLKSIKMYPLDFEEFTQLFNIDSKVFDRLKLAYDEKKPVDEMVHRKMMEIFNLYMIIGGMPAAVEKYRVSNNIDEVMDEHKGIIEQYKLDFTQYETENRKLILSNIYELIPAELNEQNKRFKIADIDKNLRYDRMSDSFTWLWKAGVALPVFNITEPRTPLMINKKSALFKLFMSDIGMLTTIYGKNCKLKIMNGDRDINKGAIFENIVAQELMAHGFDLYYLNNKKNGELDFVIELNEEVLPIEVKSGKDYKRHSALNKLLAEDRADISEAIVFTNNNISTDGKISYLPIYMIMFLQEQEIDFVDISPERFSIELD